MKRKLLNELPLQLSMIMPARVARSNPIKQILARYIVLILGGPSSATIQQIAKPTCSISFFRTLVVVWQFRKKKAICFECLEILGRVS